MKEAADETFITIVTVVYNGERTLEDTIRSVIAQVNVKKQYIIIDGGSSDATLSIIKKYADAIDLWISKKDRGIYDAMNKGIDLAKGEWLMFMNSGDRLADTNVLQRFSSMVKPFDEFVYGDALTEYPTFTTVFKRTELSEMWKQMPFCHQASFVKTAVARELRFNLDYKLSADYDFIYRAYKAGKVFRSVDLMVCLFDFKDSASKDNRRRSLNERMNIVLKNDFTVFKQLYYFVQLGYTATAEQIKKLLGNRLTQAITRLLRHNTR